MGWLFLCTENEQFILSVKSKTNEIEVVIIYVAHLVYDFIFFYKRTIVIKIHMSAWTLFLFSQVLRRKKEKQLY